MSKDSQNLNDQEIDLSQFSKKIGKGFQNFSFSIFKGIQFLIKNVVIISILIVLGVVLGFLMDRTEKSYTHQIIVIPNFNSTDYLYSKIDLIEAKIKEGDTVFLKSMGLKNPKTIKEIEIAPIIDTYTFIRNDKQNFELLKLIAENEDIDKVLKDKVTSKNYPYHLISFSTKGKITNENTITPLLASLNNSAYFKIVQKNIIENVNIKIKSNDQTLQQIDSILNNYASSTGGNVKNDKMLYYNNENNQMNEVLRTKYELITEQGSRKIELINYDKIIKDLSVTTNIKKESAVNGRFKLLLPIVFILLFIAFRLFLSFYKKQSLKYKSANL